MGRNKIYKDETISGFGKSKYRSFGHATLMSGPIESARLVLDTVLYSSVLLRGLKHVPAFSRVEILLDRMALAFEGHSLVGKAWTPITILSIPGVRRL
jgi:hypothetical protein